MWPYCYLPPVLIILSVFIILSVDQWFNAYTELRILESLARLDCYLAQIRVLPFIEPTVTRFSILYFLLWSQFLGSSNQFLEIIICHFGRDRGLIFQSFEGGIPGVNVSNVVSFSFQGVRFGIPRDLNHS